MFFQTRRILSHVSAANRKTGASEKQLRFFLLFNLLLSAALLGAQTTWTGAANSIWSNAGNWSNGVPDVNDVVTIPNVSNDPIINSAAVAKSVTLQAGAELVVTSAGSLSVNGATGIFLTNNGMLTNSGTISLGNITAGSSYGFQNAGTFTNNAGATLTIDRVSQYTRGIFNTSAGTVTNNGRMILGANGSVGTDAIWNDGTFVNNGCSALIHILSDGDILNLGGTFTNSGVIIENSIWNSNITVNTGIVQNLNFGNFSITTNNGLLTNQPGIIWTGCTSTSWATASNWATGSIPAATEHVLIPDRSNDPVIASIVSCRSMHMMSGSQLTINAGASLSIDGSGQTALQCFGTLTNNGTLSIGSTSDIGAQGLIVQDGTFNNNSGAQLNINRTNTSGLYNYNSTFNNSGQITIGALGTVGTYGLVNQGTFFNNASGNIKTDQSTQGGLLNQNSSTFNNYGNINVGSVSGVGNYGINNWGIINNYSSGQIAIDRSGLYGFYNSTAITDGLVNNTGKITIGALAGVGSHALYNVQDATFNNNACGQLIINYPLANYGNMSNGGLLRSNTTAAHANSGFTNDGVIEYPLGTPIPNVSNNDVIVNKITGSCGAYSPALQLGAQNSFTSTTNWYQNVQQSTVAGTYNQATNTFTPTNLPGSGTYTLYFTLSGSGCSFPVSLQYTYASDQVPPTVVCKNATVNLNAAGLAAVASAEVFQSGSDNCGTVAPQSVSPNSFTCSNLGNNIVILTANDGNGNTATCNATVTVNDNTAPTVVCKNATVNLSAAGSASISTSTVFQSGSDNCGTVNQVSVLPSGFICANYGANTVTLTVNDGHGNTATCTATVTVADNIAPTITCKNIGVSLNASGNASITPSSVLQSASDNCGSMSPQSVTPNSFTCSDLGANIVTLIVNDGHGNTGTCTGTVTISDNTAPTVVCKNATVNLNAAGLAAVASAEVVQSASDNCGTVNQVSVSPNSFTCTNLGTNTVTLTVNDGHSNTATCTATITVNDNTAPSVTCKNAMVSLNLSGIGNIAASDVFQSGTDNCGTVNQQSVSPNSFTCANFGSNTVTLTANDGHGNTTTCTATVMVNDNIAPNVVCKNTTVNMPAGGTANISVGAVFQSGTDNCGTVNQVSVSPNSFTCSNLGANTVTLTVNDGHSNTATCTATVTLTDNNQVCNAAPTAVCQSITVNACSAVVTAAQVNNGSSDPEGGPLDLSISPAGPFGVGVTTVVLTVTDNGGVTASCSSLITVNDNIAPTVVCKPATVNLNAAGLAAVASAEVFLSGSDNCGTVNQVSVTPNSFTCNNIGNNIVTLLVNDGHGNTATCTATVTVNDNIAPSIGCKNATVNLSAAGTVSIGVGTVFQSASDNCGTVNQQSLIPNSFTCSNFGTNTVVLTVNDSHGNTATCSATITVNDNISPSVVCKNASVNLSAGGSANISAGDVFQSGTDNCGTVNQVSVTPNSFTCSNIGTNTVTLTVNDGHANTATCSAVITVNDNTVPTVVCKNFTADLGAGNGVVNITTANVFQSGTDNCGTVNQVSVSPNSFTCGNAGTNIVTLTVNDGHGNTATCNATVTLTDNNQFCNAPPTAVCQNISVNAGASCNATVAATAVNNGSSDPENGVLQFAINPAGPFALGASTVTLTVTDNGGLSSSCTAVITVTDNTAPTVVCKNASVNLSATGTANISVGDVLQSASDNCGNINQISVTPDNFTCSNFGTNTVVLTVNDGHGNTATCSATVTVNDNIAPTVVCKNASVNLSAAGTATISVGDVFNSGTDNCGTVNQVSVTPNTFTCSNIGTNTVTLMVNDGHGNTATCSATVTVNDNIAPTVVCKNASVNLSATSTANISVGDVFQSASDNCGTVNQVSVTPNTFTCSNIGTNTVTLTVNDGHGNTATCSATVTVNDNIAPTVVCKNATVNLSAAGLAAVASAEVFLSASDNCGTVNQVSVTPNTFTCSNIGTNTVTLTVNDGHGNTATCLATVTVNDNIAPTVVCKNTAVYLNAAGTASISPGDVFQSGTDNCGTVNVQSVSQSTFTCANFGFATVTLTANDGHGNTATCTASVKVLDIVPPTVVCKNATISLSAGGTANVSVGDVFQSGTDNCGSVTPQSVTPNSFTCNNLGANTVVLTVNDGHGNIATCQATVTVTDAILPLARCKNATVNLAASGSMNTPVDAINNASSDNCSFTLSATPAILNCANIGNTTVVLKATDNAGNTATCTAIVTLRDLAAPTASCKTITVYLDQNGHASITPAMVNNNSYDPCGIATMTINNSEFDCAQTGGSPVYVLLTVKDVSNNTSTCLASVYVKDNTAPNTACEDVTVSLNAQGKVTVSGAELAGGSYDNCSVWSYSPVAKVYTSANIGVNNLTVTVKDFSGNAATCISQVTVLPYGNFGGNTQSRGEFQNEQEDVLALRVFPNPADATATVSFELPADQAFRLMLFDMTGRLVFSQDATGTAGSNILPIMLNDLLPGLYIIDFQSESIRSQRRLLIQR